MNDTLWWLVTAGGWIGVPVLAFVAWVSSRRVDAAHARELATLRAVLEVVRADRDAAIKAAADATRYAQDQERLWQDNFMQAFGIVDRLRSTTALVVSASSTAVERIGQAPGTGPLDWRALFPVPAQSALLTLLLSRPDRFGTADGRTLLLAGLPDEPVGQIRRGDTPREDLTAILEGTARYDVALLQKVLDNAADVVGQQSQTGAALRAWREGAHL